MLIDRKLCDVDNISTRLEQPPTQVANPFLRSSSMVQQNNITCSPPFYTHPQGYKLCLKMYTNGNGDGEGTHVSIYDTLLRAGRTMAIRSQVTSSIIELLNCREDKNHHKMTLKNNVERHAFVQVSEETDKCLHTHTVNFTCSSVYLR